MRIALIASHGASAFFEAFDAFGGLAGACIADRPCEALVRAREREMSVERIDDESRTGFSAKAAAALDRLGPFDAVILMFDRIVGAPLLECCPLLNVHPSLLPAFPGLGAVAAAQAAGASEFGATLHGLTERVDGGPIVAQVRSPLSAGASLAQLEKISFVHKLYVILVGFELLERGALRFKRGLPVTARDLPNSAFATPCLATPRLVARVDAIQRREHAWIS